MLRFLPAPKAARWPRKNAIPLWLFSTLNGLPLVLILFLIALATHWHHFLLRGALVAPSVQQWSVGCLFLALTFIRASEFSWPLRLLVRFLGTVLTAFAVSQAMPSSITFATLSAEQWFAIYALPPLALAGGLLGWWRPAGYILPICACGWYRFAFASALGVPFGWNEEMTLQECALFLLSGGLAIAALIRSVPSARHYRDSIFSSLIMAACAIHFANYFYSGIAKLSLDGGPLSWLTTNTTYTLQGSADRIGVNIFSSMPLGQFLYRAFRENILLMNILTMGIQLLALVAMPFLPLVRIMLLVYDMMHLAIGGLTGIFFYLWMSINIAFAIAMGYLTVTFSWAARIVFVGMMLLAPRAFTIFEAGWYETHGFNSVIIEAVNADGSSARVSPRVFGFFSYLLMSDAVLDQQWKKENAIPTGFFGTTYYSRDRETANSCVLAPPKDPMKLGAYIKPAIQALHAGVVQPKWYWPSWLVFPPQHFLQNHNAFAPNSAIHWDQVVAYRFIWRATCIRDVPTGYELDTLRSDAVSVPVR
ncbi:MULTISPECIES: hypothetical protein [unclassified Bradyrhizobium]|uniref:hypothetical protein n=1 Tax=Bradyrhizobium sp. USDA 4541 TaxID=2817704 RepID=UPI0020A375B6|nr:hypothetical protein [Bradyrhizobium sp. USDA 4541]MCP1852776.1 hypothetical protein [Bradyrhizobium sp. USDA 4541]